MATRTRTTLLLSAFLAAGATAQVTQELIKIQETGPRDKRVNMVIIGDGYTALEKAKFQSHLQMIADAVLKAPPLTAYASYFNIYAIFVPSNQSGADDPSRGITRDTYFGAHYSGRLLTINDRTGIALIDKLVPEADMHFAVVNDETYGGSGGQVAVANFADPEIIAHEAQHTFSALGDEYDYAGTSPFEAPNTTRSNTRATVRWSHWVEQSTPIPTPETQTYAKLPGVFEGAAYNPVGWFRPKQNCRMRENNIPFCEVCMEAIILHVYDAVSPLDSALPKPGAVAAFMNEAPALRVVAKKPVDHELSISWMVDGVAATDVKGPVFTKVLAPGKHTVIARVADTTHLVRLDPKALLSDTAAWQVTVSSSVRTAPLVRAAAPALLRADAHQLWLQAEPRVAYRLRLTGSDGRVVEERREIAPAGSFRLGWRQSLQPGVYLAELEQGKLGASRLFIIGR